MSHRAAAAPTKTKSDETDRRKFEGVGRRYAAKVV